MLSVPILYNAIRAVLTVVTAIYWTGLFIGTHIPIDPEALPTNLSDKWMHWMAFAGLGFLLGLRYAVREQLRLRGAFRIWLLLAGYGVVDEVLQIPVNRTADPADWAADIAGAACGLVLAALAARAGSQRFRTTNRANRRTGPVDSCRSDLRPPALRRQPS